MPDTKELFDYRQISPENADTLRQIGISVTSSHKNRTALAIECGKGLKRAKALLPRGKFGAWCKLECGFSLKLAQQYMRLATEVEKNNEIEQLPLAVAKLVSAPSTPPEFVAKVLTQVREGGRPRFVEVAPKVRAARQPKPVVKSGIPDADPAPIASLLLEKLDQEQLRKLISWLTAEACERLRTEIERRLGDFHAD